MVVAISALLCLGGLMVYSAAASVEQHIDWKHVWQYASVRRLIFVPVVWLVLAITSRFPYRWLIWRREKFWISPLTVLTVISGALLVLVLIPGIGAPRNNSWRWLQLGPVSFQPSELAKWTLALFLPAYCWWRGEGIKKFWRGYIPPCLILGGIAGLVGKEDFGTAVLIGAVGLAVLLMGGVRWWHLLVWLPVLAAAFYFLVYQNEYRWPRVQAYLHGEETAQDTAYHARQSIMAVGAGGVWGVGLGKGTIKQGWVPEDTTDFIFAIIGEELGLAGAILVVGLYAVFIVASLLIIYRARDELQRLMAAGVALTIGIQAVMNLMVVTGLAPTKGIALPFVSAGGTGLLITAAATGILVNIGRSQSAPLVEPKKGEDDDNE